MRTNGLHAESHVPLLSAHAHGLVGRHACHFDACVGSLRPYATIEAAQQSMATAHSHVVSINCFSNEARPSFDVSHACHTAERTMQTHTAMWDALMASRMSALPIIQLDHDFALTAGCAALNPCALFDHHASTARVCVHRLGPCKKQVHHAGGASIVLLVCNWLGFGRALGKAHAASCASLRSSTCGSSRMSAHHHGFTGRCSTIASLDFQAKRERRMASMCT